VNGLDRIPSKGDGEEREENRYNTWWSKHPKWTFFLGELGLSIALFFTSIYSPLYVWEAVTTLVSTVVVVVCSLWLEIWYLRRLRRSLWFLFLNLVPAGLGFILLFLLEDKSNSIYPHSYGRLGREFIVIMQYLLGITGLVLFIVSFGFLGSLDTGTGLLLLVWGGILMLGAFAFYHQGNRGRQN